MLDGWEEPCRTVWYNIQIAETFIKRAEQGGIAPDVSVQACLIIAASALWSAVDIFNERVAGKAHLGWRFNSRKGKKTTTSDWFKECERLVDLIRNGAVHAGRPPSGVGHIVHFGETTATVTRFFWVKEDGSAYEEIAIGEVVSRLNSVADRIKKHVFNKTKTVIIPGC